ncbi:hypothetical protein, partial [Aeribacillus composti]|uniref:hypothetical protein n=1 Tax=Aeribacillus composti TaxID=1868734 RepID=UPI003D1957C9
CRAHTKKNSLTNLVRLFILTNLFTYNTILQTLLDGLKENHRFSSMRNTLINGLTVTFYLHHIQFQLVYNIDDSVKYIEEIEKL